MGYPIHEKLVVATTSSALFDLRDEDEIFRTRGVEAFRKYQRQNRSKTPNIGPAFPFISRLLQVNHSFEVPPVEVVLLSRNDPEAGLRIMDALRHYDLDITRASFLSGGSPYKFMSAYNAVLYLSANQDEVVQAVEEGYAAGFILPSGGPVRDDEETLRLSFDFDGVLVDDEAEQVYEQGGLSVFHSHELSRRADPLNQGLLMPLLKGIARIQKLEAQRHAENPSYVRRIRVSVVTARNAPAHERIFTTLNDHEIEIDELHLTGGIEKKRFLDEIKPQIFFDDQMSHLAPASLTTPCAHVPFGIRNKVVAMKS